jgi:hypothetical protein
MSDPGDLHDDDALLGQLRGALEQLDAVPADATEVAVAAAGMRRLDDELATLVVDSLLDAGPRVRHDGPTARQLSFTSAHLSLEIELAVDGQTLIGAVSPAAVVEVETEGPGATAATRSDELGRFRLALGQGWCRLRVRAPGASMVTPVIVR